MLVFFIETGSHIAQTDLDLSVESGMSLNP